MGALEKELLSKLENEKKTLVLKEKDRKSTLSSRKGLELQSVEGGKKERRKRNVPTIGPKTVEREVEKVRDKRKES